MLPWLRMNTLWLVATHAQSGGTDCIAIPLSEGAFTIGRAPSCDLALVNAKVSRVHVVLERAGDEVTFTDAGSTAGILLNGRPAETESRLTGCGVRILRDTTAQPRHKSRS